MEVSLADLRPKDQVQLNVYNENRNNNRSSPQHLQYSYSDTISNSNNYSQFSPQNARGNNNNNNTNDSSTSTVLAAALPQTRSAKRWQKFRAVANVVNTSKQRLQASLKSRPQQSQSQSSALVVAGPRLLNPKLQLQRLMQPTELKRKRNANKHYKSQLAVIQENNRDLLQQARMEKMDFSYQRRELEKEVQNLVAKLEHVNDYSRPYYPDEIQEPDPTPEQDEKEVERNGNQRITMTPEIATTNTPTDQASLIQTSRADPMAMMAPILRDPFIISEDEEGNPAESPMEPSTSDPDPVDLAQPLRPQVPPKVLTQATAPPPKDTRSSRGVMLPKDPMTSGGVESIAVSIAKQSKQQPPSISTKPLRVRNTLSRARVVTNNNNTNPNNLPPMETSPKDPLTATSLELPRAVPILINNNHNHNSNNNDLPPPRSQ